MNEPDHLAETRRWLRFAAEDLGFAETAFKEEGNPPRHICWLAQQAAEKALKGALVFLQKDFSKTHDLDALRNLLPKGWRARQDCPGLADLTEWALEARYPGDWPEATRDDARAALKQARGVLEAVMDDLGRNGFVLDAGD
jgi:HEPN domain-containing protein